MELSSSLFVLVTEALSSQHHEPSTNCDGRVDMDFFHVTILGSLVFEANITLCALLSWLVGLHVRLKLLGRCETLSTVLMLTRMRLAVDHPHVPLHQPLVRTRVVTVLVMVTLVGLHFRTLPDVIGETLLKKIQGLSQYPSFNNCLYLK